MKRLMKKFLLIGIGWMSIGAGYIYANLHVMHNKIGKGELRLQLKYEGGCAPSGVKMYSGQRLINGIAPGQSITIDSGGCRLSSISGNSVVVRPNPSCDEQSESAHECSRTTWETTTPSSYNAPAGGDGDGEWAVTESQIFKMRDGVNQAVLQEQYDLKAKELKQKEDEVERQKMEAQKIKQKMEASK